MEKILGIDLGTSNSAGAVLEPMAGRNRYIARIVKEEEEESQLNYIPSVVFFENGKDEPIVGQRAKRLANDHPERGVMRLKTKMGSDYTVNIDGKEYTPEMISTFILKRIKKLAEGMKGVEAITEVRISVPSIFDSAQKEATLEAAKSIQYLFSIERDIELEEDLDKEGNAISERLKKEFESRKYSLPEKTTVKKKDEHWEIIDKEAERTLYFVRREGKKLNIYSQVDIITEPVATAFACRDYYKVIGENDRKLMVIDIGAGTTDIEIVDVSGGILAVVYRTGHDKVGGDNIDEEIIKYLKEEFKKQIEEQDGDVSLIDDADTNNDLRREAESAKIQLSTQRAVEIFVEIKDYFVNTTLTRAKQEELISTDTDGKESIITRIRKEIRRAFDESGLKKEDIDKIALVGGPTNMPIIRKMVEEEVGEWEEKVDPFTCVAIGAAHSGLVIDITPFSYGLADVIMADKLEEYEGEKIKTFTAFDEIIERGALLPAVGKKVVTAEPGTFKIPLCIAQEKYADKKIYKVLGDYEYYLPMPEGREDAEEGEEIKIKFTLKRNEILDVTAEDVRSGEKLNIRAKAKKRGEIIKLVRREEEPVFPALLAEIIKKMGWTGYNAINTMRKAMNLLESGFVRDKEKVKNAIDRLNEVINNMAVKMHTEATTKALTEAIEKAIEEGKMPKIGDPMLAFEKAMERGIIPKPDDPAFENAVCEIVRLEVEVSERDKDMIERKTAGLMDVMEKIIPIEKAIESAEEAIDKAEVKLQEVGISDKDRREITSKIDEVENAIRGREFRQIMHRTTELESMIENL